jgi:hypothetical protein
MALFRAFERIERGLVFDFRHGLMTKSNRETIRLGNAPDGFGWYKRRMQNRPVNAAERRYLAEQN